MIDRRSFVVAAFGAAASSTGLGRALAQEAAASRITAYRFSFQALSGDDIRLADYAGRPMLIVNTASQCGYTPQYAGLQALWAEFKPRGLMIVAVPSNDFGGQEPGGVSEITETAQHQYGVGFPIAAKTVVKGAAAHPFYRWAAAARPRIRFWPDIGGFCRRTAMPVMTTRRRALACTPAAGPICAETLWTR